VLINNGVSVSQDIWHIKVKIKVFLWYLKQDVILTTNLVRRNWNGDRRCCFGHCLETVQHLFYCLYANFLWCGVYLLFIISPPRSIDDLFNRWSKLASKKYNALLLTAASVLYWVVWLTRNELVFHKGRPKSFLQVQSGKYTGSDNGQDYSSLMTCENS
jgi:hypothetical protein